MIVANIELFSNSTDELKILGLFFHFRKITLFSTFTMSKVQGQYKLVQEARDLKTTESAKDHL